MEAIKMKPGVRVRMSEACKAGMIANGSHEHIEEFGDSVGVLVGPVDFGNGQLGPEWDVRWEPTNLRYGYAADDLDEVSDGG